MRSANFTMFEATRIPPEWVECHRRQDLVIVPTESSRSAWIRGGVPKGKIRICPLGIDAVRFSRRLEPLDLELDRRTRMLNVSEFSPRKNLPGLLRAWILATRAHDDAALVLKTGGWTPGAGERLEAEIAQVEQQLGRKLRDAAPVVFLREIFSDEDMARLYRTATHYISVSFGEGWDQPMMEAAASGLRLIAPAHSAYMAYLDDKSATLLPSREIPAEFPGDAATAALFQNARWWKPDEDAAIAAIRAAIDGRDLHKPGPRERILEDFTWAKAAARLVEILSELEGPPWRRWFS
jgi:glycosyltransferase involved in cell wall biosynthesis